MATTATTMKATKTARLPMTALRKSSLAAGIFYLITFVSIPTLALYESAKKSGYIVSAGPDTSVLVGGLLELIVAIAGIGTAVALFPVIKRQNEGVALGLVSMRTLEAATIFAGVATLLSLVSLRQAGVGQDALLTGQLLSAQYSKTFLVGQALIPAGNALLLGYLMYRSRLVPRVLPVIGLIGAPILIASVIAKWFGLYDEVSSWSLLGALPIAAWEFSLGVYLTVKGFKSCAITREMTAEAASGVSRVSHS
jgi:Domain of unknown function (DUF4386)